MELILVRHAEPAERLPPSVDPADPPLSPRGVSQAESVAEWIALQPIDAIVSSPAERARQTAAPLAARTGLPIQVDDRLRDAPSPSGGYVPIERDRERDSAAYRNRLRDYRSGARFAQIAPRVEEALAEWSGRHGGGRIAVFGHGSTVNVFAAGVLGLPTAGFLEAAYASVHRFLISSAGIRSVRSLNETAHLQLRSPSARRG